jgi:hypothetical protein
MTSETPEQPRPRDAPPAGAPADEDVDAFRRSMARGRRRVPTAIVVLVVVPLLALGAYAIYVFVALCSAFWQALTKGRL